MNFRRVGACSRAFTNHSRVGVALAAAAVATLALAAPASAGVISQGFGFTGGEQDWVVPPGVGVITVVASGAAGGGSSANSGPAGQGGTTVSDLYVTPGETLAIFVGNPGEPEAPLNEVPAEGGYNGGGDGAVSICCDSPYAGEYASWGGGGGGGASDVRQGGNTLSSRVIVAGGGGGAGSAPNDGDQCPGYSADAAGAYGGAGGGLVGGDGGAPDGSAWPGPGGTQTSGGSPNGGSFGAGSAGENSPHPRGGGGGGGGGYYGGGGGGDGDDASYTSDPLDRCWVYPASAGGGGGSSYTDPSVTDNVTLTQGDNSGNGHVTFTYTAATLSQTVSAGVVVGGQISDTAQVDDVEGPASAPAGAITFNLYGPDDGNCSSPPVFTQTRAILAQIPGPYPSQDFTPTVAGTYRWVVEYSGDSSNPGSATGCGDSNATVVVSKESPTLSSDVAPAGTVGDQIRDSVALAGGYSPTGTIAINLYGPNDSSCSSTPVFTDSIPVDSGNGDYQSAAFTPDAPGTYTWTADYSGDPSNSGAPTSCQDPGASIAVSRAAPTLATTASDGVLPGGEIHATTALAGGAGPGGQLTFRLYGSTDPTCSDPPVSSDVDPVSGNGSYESNSYVATVPGTYRWTATYSGDANNDGASTSCGDPGADVEVSPATVQLSASASVGVKLGGSVTDAATLSGGQDPGGTLTYRLFGPADIDCSAPAVFMATAAVTGAGTYPSTAYVPTAVGTYHWTATYSGDSLNSAAATSCGDVGQGVRVQTNRAQCQKAEGRLASAKSRLKTLRRRNAPRQQIHKARKQLNSAKQSVKKWC